MTSARVEGTKLKLAIASLGSIGLEVAKYVDRGDVPGIELSLVTARSLEKAKQNVIDFSKPPKVVPLDDFREFDILLECAPSALYESIAEKAIAEKALMLSLSVGALLDRMYLVEKARENGASIIVPTGALLGLDAVRAAAQSEIYKVQMVTRKPPGALAGAPFLVENNILIDNLTDEKLVFSGSAREAARGFPANVNVGAALALAGIGPDRTTLEIWADPNVDRNIHKIIVESDSSDFSMTIENRPSDTNPGTGKITALSAIAALKRLSEPLVIGT